MTEKPQLIFTEGILEDLTEEELKEFCLNDLQMIINELVQVKYGDIHDMSIQFINGHPHDIILAIVWDDAVDRIFEVYAEGTEDPDQKHLNKVLCVREVAKFVWRHLELPVENTILEDEKEISYSIVLSS